MRAANPAGCAINHLHCADSTRTDRGQSPGFLVILGKSLTLSGIQVPPLWSGNDNGTHFLGVFEDDRINNAGNMVSSTQQALNTWALLLLFILQSHILANKSACAGVWQKWVQVLLYSCCIFKPDYLWILGLPLTSCVTIGKFLNFSVPQFPVKWRQ